MAKPDGAEVVRWRRGEPQSKGREWWLGEVMMVQGLEHFQKCCSDGLRVLRTAVFLVLGFVSAQ